MIRIVRYTYCAIIALFALSCNKAMDDSFVDNGPIPIPEKISAHIPTFDSETKSLQGSGFIEDAPESWDAADDVDTRTYAVPDPETITNGEAGEYYQYWSKGDEISLFVTQANLKYRMKAYTTGLMDQGEFHIVDNKTTGETIETEYYYSVYPYKNNTTINYKGNVTYEFPGIQHYSGDTYANGENGMIAREPKNGTDSVLFFQNFCSYLQLRLVAQNGATNVKKITLTANDPSVRISGLGTVKITDAPEVDMKIAPAISMDQTADNQIILDCGSGVKLSDVENQPTKFWFVVPGGLTFSNGFTIIVVYDDYNYYKKATQKSIRIERSHIKPMATIRPDDIQKPTGPIRYKYNDTSNDVPFTLSNTFYGENGEKLEVTGQVYDEQTGEWIVLLSGTLKSIRENSFIKENGPDIAYIKIDSEDESVAINDFAFHDCSADSLMVYSPVDSICGNAFNASTLKELKFYEDVNYIKNEAGSGSTIEQISILANVGTVAAGAFDQCKTLEEFYVDGNLKTIGNNAFKDCDGLTKLTVEGQIKSIGNSTFEDSDALELIHIHGDIESIGEAAFFGCDLLSAIEVHGSIGSIGRRSFSGLECLETIDIKGSIGTIGQSAFSDCDALRNFNISGDVVMIDREAFHSCDLIEAINISGHVGTIGQEAFEVCDALKTVNIGSVDSIEYRAFYQCHNLTEVNMPGLKYVGMGAFRECTSLQTISLDSVVTIEDNAFMMCSSLTKIVIPESCTMIGEGAFCNAGKLKEVYCYAVYPPFIKSDNDKSSDVFTGTASGLIIYVPSGSHKYYTDNEYFIDHTYDDPKVKATINWWYENYRNMIKKMPPTGNLEGWTESNLEGWS